MKPRRSFYILFVMSSFYHSPPILPILVPFSFTLIFSNFVVFRNNYFVISLKLWVVFLQKYLDVAQSRIQQTITVEVEDHLKLNLDHFWSDMHMHTVKVS